MMSTNDFIRKEFTDWLHKNFNFNVDNYGNAHEIFNDNNDQINVLLDDNESFICYDVRGEFTIIELISSTNPKRKLYEQYVINSKEGKQLMKEQVLRKNLLFEWEESNINIISKKLFCLDRKFTLKKINNDYDDEDFFEWTIEGVNTFKPFPDNVLLRNDGNDISIHAFVVDKLVLRSEESKKTF